MGSGGYLEERVPDAGDVVAVGVLRSHEDGVGRALLGREGAVVEKPRLLREPEVTESGDRDEGRPGVRGVDQRPVANGRIAAGRRCGPVGDPLVHRHDERPAVDVVVEWIAEALADAPGRLGGRGVLVAGQEVGADVVRKLDMAAPGVGDHQRSGADPHLGVGVDVEDLRAVPGCLAAGQDSVGLAAHRVGQDTVGEGEVVARHRVLFVLARVVAGHREGDVELGQPGTRHDRKDALEDDTPLQVLVESLVEPVAEEPAALGDAHPHRHLDVTGQGVRGSGLVLSLVAEEGDDVARPGEADPHDDRILGRIDELVDRSAVEAGRPVDADLVLGQVRPAQVGRRPARIPRVLAHGQRCRRRVQVGGGVGERRRARVLGVVEDELVPVDAGDRGAVGLGGDRELAAHQAALARHVGLPAVPDHRIALVHQEPGSDLRCQSGIVRVRAAVYPVAHGALPAPIEDVVEDATVSPCRIDRLEDLDVHPVLDSAPLVAGCPLQVHDPGVAGVRRVELAVRIADQPLVRAHLPEDVALEGRAVPLRDHESGDLRVGICRVEYRDQRRRQGGEDRNQPGGSSHRGITWFGGLLGTRAGPSSPSRSSAATGGPLGAAAVTADRAETGRTGMGAPEETRSGSLPWLRLLDRRIATDFAELPGEVRGGKAASGAWGYLAEA